jgi:hypothetical protein
MENQSHYVGRYMKLTAGETRANLSSTQILTPPLTEPLINLTGNYAGRADLFLYHQYEHGRKAKRPPLLAVQEYEVQGTL